jgi:hypothetical protein
LRCLLPWTLLFLLPFALLFCRWTWALMLLAVLYFTVDLGGSRGVTAVVHAVTLQKHLI